MLGNILTGFIISFTSFTIIIVMTYFNKVVTSLFVEKIEHFLCTLLSREYCSCVFLFHGIMVL